VVLKFKYVQWARNNTRQYHIFRSIKVISLTSFAIISIENRMNANTLITSDHISRNARAIVRFFIYDILNKITKESIFGTYFVIKHLQLFIEIFVLVLLLFRVEFSFICPFFPDIQPRLCWFSRAFTFLHLVPVGQQLFRRRKQTGFKLFCV